MIKLTNIICRKAKLTDIKDIILMAHEFYLEFIGKDNGDFDFEHVGIIAGKIIAGNDMAIFLVYDETKPVGMFYIYLSKAYFNPKISCTEVHHMYLQKKYRNSSAVKVMLKAIREWAKNKKAFWLRDKRTEDSIEYRIYKGDEKCQTQLQPQQS